MISFKKVFPYFIFPFFFFLYIHNLSRSVYGGDVGDLVTAAKLGGVPHPPGYPLFTLLGFLLTRLPTGQTPAFMVGIISSFSGALAAVFFFLFVFKLTKNFLISLLSTSILALSYFFWIYSEIAEVFALNNLFVILLFYIAYLYNQKRNIKILFLFWFLLGLSLTNHQTILLIFPSLFLLIFSNIIKDYKTTKNIFFSLLFFLLGFSFYIYVPIASSHHPAINWDNVHDISSFFRLFLRKDYGTFQASIYGQPLFTQRIIILKTYFLSLLYQLTFPVIFIIFLGSIFLFFKNRLLFFAFLLGFVLSGPVFIGYAGLPLIGSFVFGAYERFFLMSSIILLFYFPFGLLYISELVQVILKRSLYIFLVQIVFFIIPFSLLFYNFEKTDLSTIWIGDTVGYDLLKTLPQHSVLLLAGDTEFFNAQYIHYTRNYRSDIHIANLNALSDDAIIGPYLLQVRNKNASSGGQEILLPVLLKVAQSHPIFSNRQIPIPKKIAAVWIPYGLTYQLVAPVQAIPKEDAYQQQVQNIWQNLHTKNLNAENTKALHSFTIADLPSLYANALLATGNFFLTYYEDKQNAKVFYDQAITLDPSYSKSYEVLGYYSLNIAKDCERAKSNFVQALSLNPANVFAYYLLYSTYADCLHDKKTATALATDFSKRFGINFYSAYKKTFTVQ